MAIGIFCAFWVDCVSCDKGVVVAANMSNGAFTGDRFDRFRLYPGDEVVAPSKKPLEFCAWPDPVTSRYFAMMRPGLLFQSLCKFSVDFWF